MAPGHGGALHRARAARDRVAAAPRAGRARARARRRCAARRRRCSRRAAARRSCSPSSTRPTRSSSGSRSRASSPSAGSGSGASRVRRRPRARGARRSRPRLFLAWLLPVVARHRVGEPGRERARARVRAVRGPAARHRPTSFSRRPRGLRPHRRSRRRGAAADPAHGARLPPALGRVRRRRLARRLRDHARPVALHAVLRRRLALAVAAARRLPARSRSRSPAGSACWRRCSAPLVAPLALAAGIVLQWRTPATSATRSSTAARPGRRGSPSPARVVALVLGLRRLPPVERDGRARLRPAPAAGVRPRAHALVGPPRRAAPSPLTPGLVDVAPRRRARRARSSTPISGGELPHRAPSRRSTSASAARATSPTRRGTARYERRPASLGASMRTGDLAIPRACGATWLLVDRDRFPHLAPDLPVAYRDERWVLYRL